MFENNFFFFFFIYLLPKVRLLSCRWQGESKLFRLFDRWARVPIQPGNVSISTNLTFSTCSPPLPNATVCAAYWYSVNLNRIQNQIYQNAIRELDVVDKVQCGPNDECLAAIGLKRSVLQTQRDTNRPSQAQALILRFPALNLAIGSSETPAYLQLAEVSVRELPLDDAVSPNATFQELLDSAIANEACGHNSSCREAQFLVMSEKVWNWS